MFKIYDITPTKFFLSRNTTLQRSLRDTVLLRQHLAHVEKIEAAKRPRLPTRLPTPPPFASFGRSMSVCFFGEKTVDE